jgi:hypothetical protein
VCTDCTEETAPELVEPGTLREGDGTASAQCIECANIERAELLAALTAESTAHNGIVAFAATVVRFGPRDGEFSIMNRQRGGWGASCYTYASLPEVAKAWRLTWRSFDRDEHSRFIRVEPLRSEVRS